MSSLSHVRSASVRYWIVAAAVATGMLGFSKQKKNEEPKSQVLPLPRQLPMAIKADTDTLDFHLSPRLKAGGLAAQIRQSLNDLIRDTRGETIVKLRAFVAGAGDARRVQAEVTQIFTDRKLPLPVLAVVQVGGLGQEAAKVVIEAVVSTRHRVNDKGLGFFSGQTGASFSTAVSQLKAAVSGVSVAPDRVLAVTCFTSRIENYEASHQEAHALFPNAAIDLIQAVRDPQTDESTCEAVGQLSQAPEGGAVVLVKDRRVALVSAPQLVFTGLQLSFGSFLDDAHEALVRLERAASASAPVEAPVQVNVFSLDPSGGSALRKTTAVPPSTFTVETIEGLPAIDASAGVEAVMAPNVETPLIR